MRCTERAYAKINLTLDVGAKRADGYHEITSVMQRISLWDTVTVERGTGCDSLLCSVPVTEDINDNLCMKALRVFFTETAMESGGVSITLEKHIPTQAGLGGGSSDAAAALVGLNRLWGLGLSADRLEEIGLTVGADVPFCVRGGLQRAQGVGERLTPLAMKKPLYLVAFQPCRGLSTKEVFTALHEDGIRGEDRPDNEAAQRALAAGDVRALGAALGNVLEPVSRRMRPEIDRAIRAIEESGAVGARMTGSGSAVFGVFMHAGACRRAADRLAAAYPTCRMMRTAAHGVVIEEEA